MEIGFEESLNRVLWLSRWISRIIVAGAGVGLVWGVAFLMNCP